MPIEPFEFTYTLTPQSAENEVLNALGKTRVKEFEPKSYFFTESSLPAQTSSTGAYGPDGTTKFNITTQFELEGKKAYAVTSGQVLIVPQSGTGNETKVNLFIKPLNHIDVGVPIKYYVYRGLKKASFINTVDTVNYIVAEGSVSNPFMAKVWIDLKGLNPDIGTEVPATVFGFNTADPIDTRLDAKFFNVVEDTTTEEHKIYNLPIITAGQHFGEFADNTGGFEIVLNDGFYHQEKSDTGFEFDMKYAKSAKVTLNTADIVATPDVSEKIYRENVQKFLDPAAFYGAHITEKEKGQITVVDNSAKHSSKEDIFTNIVSKFFNKHKCYLYIQCNRGRSFNFDETLGTEPLKIGVSETVLPREYKTDGWPIIISDFEQTHDDGETDAKKGMNNLSFELKFKTVSKSVTLYNSYGNCANETVEGNFLGSKALVDEANIATQDYTNTVKYKLTNDYNIGSTSLTTKSIASFIYINQEEKDVKYFNDFFGPAQIDHFSKPNDPSNQKNARKSLIEKPKTKNSPTNGNPSINKLIYTTLPYINPINQSTTDDLFRLYVLKKIASNDSVNNTSNDYASRQIIDSDDYGQFQYGDKNYKVWKGQITYGSETIKTLQLINFEAEGNVTNYMQLGLMGDDYNKVIYDSLTSTSTIHIPEINKNRYFHLDETGIVQNSLFKKYKLGVKVEKSNPTLGFDYIFPSAENEVYVYTVDGHYFFTKEFSEKFEYVEEFADGTINFKPKSTNLEGFGFDWMRLSGGSELSYEDSILNGYEGRKFDSSTSSIKYDFGNKYDAFEALQKEYITIHTQQNNIYYVPYLTLYPDPNISLPTIIPFFASLTAKIKIYKNLTKLELDYDTSLFAVTAQFPSNLNVGEPEFDIDIFCDKEFNTDKYIKILAHSQEANGLSKVNLAGIIKVRKNSIENRKKIKLVWFEAETDIDNNPLTIEKGTIRTAELNTLRQVLYQANIDVEIEGPIALDLKNDNDKFKLGKGYIDGSGNIKPNNPVGVDGDEKQDYLKTKVDAKYKNYFRVYVFDLPTTLDTQATSVQGNVQSIGKHSVCLYRGSNPRSNTVLAHEVCHGLGLFHTHVNGSIKDPSQKYTYHYGLTDPIRTDDDPTKATDNIMSYNQNRKTTWKWQWDIMHNHLKNYIDEK